MEILESVDISLDSFSLSCRINVSVVAQDFVENEVSVAQSANEEFLLSKVINKSLEKNRELISEDLVLDGFELGVEENWNEFLLEILNDSCNLLDSHFALIVRSISILTKKLVLLVLLDKVNRDCR